MKTRQELEAELKSMNFESEEELWDHVDGQMSYQNYNKLEGEYSKDKAKHLWNKWQEELNGNSEQLPTIEVTVFFDKHNNTFIVEPNDGLENIKVDVKWVEILTIQQAEEN